MKRVLTQIMRILTREQKRGILLLMAGGLVLALLDTISVALMAPFMTLLTDLAGYEESIFGKLMANTFGVTSKEQAILILTIGFIVLYIVRGVLKIGYQFWQARAIANYRADLATRLFSNVMHIYVYLGIIGLVLATLPFIGYDLTREMHDKCVKEIAEREAAAAAQGELTESEVAAQ